MFPSTLKGTNNGIPRRSDSLNATQQKSSSQQIFRTIEEELHDARRVHSHGQEEDLRLALSMIIDRVGELSSLLSEAYKSNAELETQVNLAKSNLQLVISNNEMLEEALKRDSSGHSKDVGWRRWSAREGEHRERISEERPQSIDSAYSLDSNSTTGTNSTATTPPLSAPPMGSPAPQDSRFFKFRFTGSSTNGGKQSNSRPVTPSGMQSPTLAPNGLQHHLTSPSLPSLPVQTNKELEELNAELERERAAHKNVSKEKAALEAEIESLSQALFEEANKMVATERIKRAETEEELKEARQEKEALRSALRLIEGENTHLRGASATPGGSTSGSPVIAPSLSHSRTSSRVAVKSRPSSPLQLHSRTSSSFSAQLPPDLQSPTTPTTPASPVEDESELTPQHQASRPPSPAPSPRSGDSEQSPGAGAPSTPPLHKPRQSSSDSKFAAAALFSMR